MAESHTVENVMTCSGHDEAQARIARAVHEIQVLCDHFGYDPSLWLANAICHPDEAPEKWDCQLCGGVVDLSSAIKPAEKAGPGGRS